MLPKFSLARPRGQVPSGFLLLPGMPRTPEFLLHHRLPGLTILSQSGEAAATAPAGQLPQDLQATQPCGTPLRSFIPQPVPQQLLRVNQAPCCLVPCSPRLPADSPPAPRAAKSLPPSRPLTRHVGPARHRCCWPGGRPRPGIHPAPQCLHGHRAGRVHRRWGG